MDMEAILEKILTTITKPVPWLPNVIGILFIILIIICIFKVYNGTMIFSFWGVKFESNKAVENIQKQFDELNEHSQLKTQVIKLLNQVSLTIQKLENISPEEFQRRIKSFYEFFLPGIISLITKSRDNSHRAAVFYQCDEKNLKILHGSGYSPEGKEYLRLSLTNSKAGYCFITNKHYLHNDITTDPTYERNPKSSREYKSLLCVPITYNDKTIGVLNIDGLKSNSFDQDDVDYMTYFANSISPILYKEILYLDVKNKKEALNYVEERSS